MSAFGTIPEILSYFPRDRTVLGLDVGRKSIGLALSSPPFQFVTPLKTIERRKFSETMRTIITIVNDYDVGAFVIGYPLNMDGTYGKAAQSVKDFAHEMLNHVDIVGKTPWIGLQDERLSTEAVHDYLDNSDHFSSYRKEKSKGRIDALAAKIILEDALALIEMGTH